MKKTITLLLGVVCVLVSSTVTAQLLSNTTFTTPNAGWYQIGKWQTGQRGSERIAVSIYGGALAPQELIIDVFKNWSSAFTVDCKGSMNSNLQKVRITKDSSYYYLEVYMSLSILSNGNIHKYALAGKESGFTINSGVLPMGIDNEIFYESGDVNATTLIGNNIAINGKIGIGTTAPLGKLDVIYSSGDGTITRNGINVKRYTETSSNITSYDKGIFSNIGYFSIDSGITDSGYKIGLDASSFSNSVNFKGTLNRNIGVSARAGIYRGTQGAKINTATAINAEILDNVTGTIIENAYGVKIQTNNYNKTTVTNRYDLYAGTATAKNYFAGNVGIGTTETEDYKLSVAGATGIIAEKVTVKLKSQWPDYVFTKDYELPTLKEVANYINTEGHLENIPSALEVKEKGIDLGDMNAKLLQKIEELTLYTIQQEKALNSQDEEIELLKEQKSKIEKLEEENKVLKSLIMRLDKLEELIEK